MLLDDKRLESSSVVANSMMNRQRRCLGGNSYQKELSFNPIEFLSARLSQQKTVRSNGKIGFISAHENADLRIMFTDFTSSARL